MIRSVAKYRTEVEIQDEGVCQKKKFVPFAIGANAN